MPQRYYLETSVIRSRLIGHSDIKKLLSKKIDTNTRITSKFVKMEFDRSLVCDLIEFYFTFKNEKSIDDAIKYWSENFQSRKIKNINYSISGVFYGVNPDDIRQGLLKLRNTIKALVAAFKGIIHRYEKNNSQCYLSDIDLNLGMSKTVEDVEKEFARFYKAIKNDSVDKCRIVDLFDNSKKIMGDIKDFDSKIDGFKTQQDRLNDIDSGKKKLSCKTCGIVGDTIITLECPNYATLLTMDKAFIDLCKIVGIKCEIIPNIRTIKPIATVTKELKK